MTTNGISTGFGIELEANVIWFTARVLAGGTGVVKASIPEHTGYQDEAANIFPGMHQLLDRVKPTLII